MKEELIKRFEKEHRLDDCGNIIETEIAESSLLAEKFTNWLIAVIADLEQENIKLAEDYLTAETQKIIAQEKYDKLKEENANLGATNETAALTGWICPSCDNSNHPFVTICSCGDAKK